MGVFKGIALSFEAKARKPEYAMFDYLVSMIKKAGYQNPEIIFIDDDPRNIYNDVLKGLGIFGIHHTCWASTRRILREKFEVEV